VRVNQVGYSIEASKRAYVMANVPEAGALFTLVDDDGRVKLRAPIGAELGSWNDAFPHVYAVDFDGVRQPGSYTITVVGPGPATSPPFTIDTAANVYRDVIANSLSFFQNERDGADYIPSDLRTAPAHLNDANAMTYLTPEYRPSGEFEGELSPLGRRIDASGGWWDAGDYVKFVQTTSYTVAVLLAGVRDFPEQMGGDSATADFTEEVRFGVEFLLRLWNDKTRTLYYQVGIGSGNETVVGDHDIWRLPQDDDELHGNDPRFRYLRDRPVFRAGPPGSPISPNLAGRDAAAFALCSIVFRSSDPELADRCLTAAQHIYDLADTNPDKLLTVIPFGFYPEREWRSDLELGAVELFFATADTDLARGLPHPDPSFYLEEAARWANAYIEGTGGDTLNLYDVSGLAHYDLYRAIEEAGDPQGLATTREALLADLKRQLDGAIEQAGRDPFQFGFPWAVWDTTSHGAGLSVMASEYDELTGTDEYADWSARWLANILGANAWGTSLIVGAGTTFPHCLQHQVTNIVGSLDGTPPILAGAVVEGPNGTLFHGSLPHMRPCPADGVDVFETFSNDAKFRDNVESFSTVEPAIDLTATSPLAFARQMAGIR
jgi:endoglucanase